MAANSNNNPQFIGADAVDSSGVDVAAARRRNAGGGFSTIVFLMTAVVALAASTITLAIVLGTRKTEATCTCEYPPSSSPSPSPVVATTSAEEDEVVELWDRWQQSTERFDSDITPEDAIDTLQEILPDDFEYECDFMGCPHTKQTLIDGIGIGDGSAGAENYTLGTDTYFHLNEHIQIAGLYEDSSGNGTPNKGAVCNYWNWRINGFEYHGVDVMQTTLGTGQISHFATFYNVPEGPRQHIQTYYSIIDDCLAAKSARPPQNCTGVERLRSVLQEDWTITMPNGTLTLDEFIDHLLSVNYTFLPPGLEFQRDHDIIQDYHSAAVHWRILNAAADPSVVDDGVSMHYFGNGPDGEPWPPPEDNRIAKSYVFDIHY